MKATEIKKLLAKDKLTVDEVGKLFLATYLSQKTGEKLPVDYEAYKLIEQLEGEEKDVFFNKYSGVPPFIHSMLKDYESTIKSFASVLMKYEAHISTFEEAEHAYFALYMQPRILTKRDYEAALLEARAKQESDCYLIIQLIKFELNTQIQKHVNGEETPYNIYFKELKTKKISAEHYSLYTEILEEMHSVLDEYELTENSTYYEVLEHLPNIFYTALDLSKEAEASLLEVCPDLCKAIVNNYSQLDGLEYLKELTLSDYADHSQAIPFKTACELDLFEARKSHEKPMIAHKGAPLLFGVAVIEEDEIFNPIPIAQVVNGTYYYTLPESTMRNIAEGLLDNSDVQKEILTLKNFLKMAGRLLNAYAYALDLMADVTGLKDYKKLKKNHMDTDLEALMSHAERAPTIIGRKGFLQFEGNTEDLQKQVTDTFNLKFKLKDIYFTAKEKAEARKHYSEYEGEELEDKINEALKYLKGRANV